MPRDRYLHRPTAAPQQPPWHGLQDIDPRRLVPAPTPEYVHALATIGGGVTVCRTDEPIPRKTSDKTSVTCPSCLDGGPAESATAQVVRALADEIEEQGGTALTALWAADFLRTRVQEL